MSNKLGDYIEFKNGLNYDKTHKGNGCKIVGVANFKNNLHINFENLDEVKSDIVSDDMLLKNDDLLFVRSNGNKSLVGRCLFVSDLQEKMSFSGFTIRARIKNKQKLLPKYFLYYATAPNFKNSLYKKIGGGTNIRNLTQAVLEDINIELPELDNQKKIANCLDQITQKIQLNNKINDELEKLAKTLYEYWFVQFDFPDENNRPYKSSGGAMVYNDDLKREVPIDFEIKYVNDFLDVVTGKEDANFSDENGQYAFFTCGDEILKCNQPAFSGKSILIAGNGNFNIKYYEGEFNAYQRTYVLIPNDNLFVGIIYLSALNRINAFTKGSNGSIVKFITKGDVENIPVIIPKNKNILSVFNKLLDKQNHIRYENEKLKNLRDFILPMLMNGQVTIQ